MIEKYRYEWRFSIVLYELSLHILIRAKKDEDVNGNFRVDLEAIYDIHIPNVC